MTDIAYYSKPINRNNIAIKMTVLTKDFRPELLEETKVNINNNISDRYKNDYYNDVGWVDIEQLYSKGIMCGKTDNGKFLPYDNATRG